MPKARFFRGRLPGVLLAVSLLLASALVLYSCGHPVDGIHVFHATVIEADGARLLIEPDPNTYERSCSDRIALTAPESSSFTFAAGDRVEVTYHEGIEETSPAQIEKVISVVPET